MPLLLTQIAFPSAYNYTHSIFFLGPYLLIDKNMPTKKPLFYLHSRNVFLPSTKTQALAERKRTDNQASSA